LQRVTTFGPLVRRFSRRGLKRRRRRRQRLPVVRFGLEPLESRVLLSAAFELSSLLPVQGGDGYDGTVIYGIDGDNFTGGAVSAAGDINGDGFEDLIIGAEGVNSDGTGYAEGASYVIFGQSGGLPATVELSSLDGENGFAILGVSNGDYSGNPVAAAGDVNGDGFDDLVIGAIGASPGGAAYAGAAYVVFGKAGVFPANLHLSSLDGSNGFSVPGIHAYAYTGYAVGTAGDINGDGFDDIIIGADGVDLDGSGYAEGAAYVVFGRADFSSSSLNLSLLDGANGFVVPGVDDGDGLGNAVGTAGDINGDGFDDLLIGARNADAAVNAFVDAGESYVLFGKLDGFTPEVSLAALDGTDGFVIYGIDANDQSGDVVGTAGDINGDGFDDLVIGAKYADAVGNLQIDAGESYVIFGTDQVFSNSIDLGALNGTNGFIINGIDTGDKSGATVSTAGDMNGDGFDDLLIGAYGADATDNVRSAAGESYILFGQGGSFTSSLALSSLDGINGFVLFGIDSGDELGRSVRTAGDVNGDGFDDFVLGALGGDGVVNTVDNTGESYVILGGDFTGAVAKIGDVGDNVLIGSISAESLIGAGGNDTLVGNGGQDVLLGGEGDDVLVILGVTFHRLVGGRGTDTLRLDGTEMMLDLLSIADNKVVDIETIDITGSGPNTLVIDVLEVLNLSSESNTLSVIKDADDTVDMGSGWTLWGSQVIDGRLFDVLTQGAARLNVLNTTTSYVAARHIFYNDSLFDGNTPAVESSDHNAIALDKVALQPGGTSSFDNYTSYSKGINGIIIDIGNSQDVGLLGAADIEFRMGHDSDLTSWIDMPPSSIFVDPVAGVAGSARITVIWDNHKIQNQWLQVTVKKAGNTGLDVDDVFYFGNAVGETGDSQVSDASLGFAKVDVFDFIGVRNNVSLTSGSVGIANHFDFDRDGRVNVFDVIATLDNRTSSHTSLNLITFPQSMPASSVQLLDLSPSPPSQIDAIPGASRNQVVSTADQPQIWTGVNRTIRGWRLADVYNHQGIDKRFERFIQYGDRYRLSQLLEAPSPTTI